MASRRSRSPVEPLGLVDEGLHLLRTVPFTAGLAAYYVGALPFAAALLFFVSDLSVAADAWRYRPEAAAGMVAAFLWLKLWQARFCSQLWGHVAGEPPPAWTWGAALGLLGRQAVVQPLALALQPLGILLLPTAPVTLAVLGQTPAAVYVIPPLLVLLALALFVGGFVQAVNVYAGLPAAGPGAVWRRAGRCATAEWGNLLVVHLLLLLALGIVLLNVLPVFFLVPLLLKHVFGVDLPLLALPWTEVLNLTTATALLAVAWLAVDPLVKAVHVLACFYHEAARTGADLRAELQALKAVDARVLLPFLVIAFGLLAPAGAPAADPAGPGLAPADLQRAIDDTLRQRRYAWRLPAEQPPPALPECGVLEGLGRMIAETADRVAKWVGAQVRDFADWFGRLLRRLLPNRPSPGPPSAFWKWLQEVGPLLAKVLKVLLVVLVAAGVGLLLYRLWRWHWRRAPVDAGLDVEGRVAPDLEAEDVTADALPEDRWLLLAQEQAAQGNLRLAVRAAYLATLALLGERQLIAIARFKSNREYQRELERRAHALPAVLEGFGQNLRVFENIWYGLYPVDQRLFADFARNAERIKGHVTADVR